MNYQKNPIEEKFDQAIKKNELSIIKGIMNNSEELSLIEDYISLNSPLITALMNNKKEIFLYLISRTEFDLTHCNNDFFSNAVGYFNMTNDPFFYKELLKKEEVLSTLTEEGYEYNEDLIIEIKSSKNKNKINQNLQKFK